MNCMKCGREIEAGRVFCEECLAKMEQYPVKPGTAVQLPRRHEPSPLRKVYGRRKSLSLEDQVKRLRKQVRRLVIALIILLAIAAALVYPAASYLLEDRDFLPGQNYSALNESFEPTEPEA